MNKPMDLSEDKTVEYYNKNTDAFINRTVDIDLSDLYPHFLKHLHKDARILDAGCGSGRDTRYFLSQGFSVVAIDASEAMVNFASEFVGQKVVQKRFEDLEYVEEFDGIWASASLLHVPKVLMNEVLIKFSRSLRTNGILYFSMKEGKQEEIINGRYFNFMIQSELQDILESHADFELVEIWITSDRQTGRNSYNWINTIARKR